MGKDLKQFGRLLKANARLSERNDLQPSFKARQQLSAFMGTYLLDTSVVIYRPVLAELHPNVGCPLS
jgi:hypothetical protein